MKETEPLMDDLPFWFKMLWLVAIALSFSIGIVIIWAIISVVSWLIG